MASPKQWQFHVLMLCFILLMELVLLKPKISSAEIWCCNKIIVKVQLNCLSWAPLWGRVGKGAVILNLLLTLSEDKNLITACNLTLEKSNLSGPPKQSNWRPKMHISFSLHGVYFDCSFWIFRRMWWRDKRIRVKVHVQCWLPNLTAVFWLTSSISPRLSSHIRHFFYNLLLG